ncbi:hypothetical protein JXM67_06485 [candidate division WOR-3 bacterium]|nr:hypothetical protein [candidate division WOR-3 bacterium]
MTIVAYVLSSAAILVMAANIWLIARLISGFSGGGEVGNRLKLLLALIAFFFLGYVISPVLVAVGLLIDWAAILVFAVFFFGAFYVTITLGVLRKIFSVLNLLKAKDDSQAQE